MKLFSIQNILCLILIGFVSCSEEDKTESSLLQSQITWSRKAPEFFPAGTILEMNPTITFTSDLKTELGSTATAKYSNSDQFSSFPEESGDQNVNITVKEAFNDEIVLSLDVTDEGDGNVKTLEIAITEFTDLGNDGYYDEFKLRATVAASPVSVGSIGVSGDDTENLRTWSGRFLGSAKPRNQFVAKPTDVRRAPTEEEFDALIIDKEFFYEIDNANETGLISFETSGLGTLTYFQNTTHTDANITGHAHQIRWLFKYENGEPELSIKTKEDDHHYRKFRLTFTDFYEGTLKEVEGFDFDQNDPFTTEHSGRFRFYKGIVFTWNHVYSR